MMRIFQDLRDSQRLFLLVANIYPYQLYLEGSLESGAEIQQAQTYDANPSRTGEGPNQGSSNPVNSDFDPEDRALSGAMTTCDLSWAQGSWKKVNG